MNENETKKGLSCFDFTIFMQNLLVSDNNYVLETGSMEDVNEVIANKLSEKVKKHPLLWKLFFKIS